MTKLKAPDGFWKLTDEEKNKLLNKCGPDGPLNSLVPNHLFFLDISGACQIHDFTFLQARTLEDHKKSDQLFLENQRILIKEKSQNPILKMARHLGALVYYSATRIYSTMNHKMKSF